MSQATVTRFAGTTVALTVLGATGATFGPAVYRYPPPATIPTGSTSLWSVGAPPELLVFVAVMIAASLALLVAVSTFHGAGRAILGWSAALVVAAGAVVALPGGSTFVVPAAFAADIPDSMGIGVYFVPAALVGLLTALVASVSGASSPAVQASWSRQPGR